MADVIERPGAKPSGTARGVAGVALGSTLFATSGIVRSLGPEVSGLFVGAWRSVVGGVALAAVAFLIRARADAGTKRRPLDRRQRVLVGIGGVAVVVYQLAFFASLDRVGVAATVVISIGTGPLVAGLLDRVILGHRLRRAWLVAVAIAIAGVAMITLDGAGTGDDTDTSAHASSATEEAAAAPAPVIAAPTIAAPAIAAPTTPAPATASPAPAAPATTESDPGALAAGVALAVLAGMAVPVYGLAAQSLMDRRTTLEAIATVFATGALIAIPLALVTSRGEPLTASVLGMVAYLGLVATAVAYWCWAFGLRALPLSMVATVALVEPAAATLMAILILGDPLSLITALGVVTVGAGVWLAQRQPAGAQHPESTDQKS